MGGVGRGVRRRRRKEGRRGEGRRKRQERNKVGVWADQNETREEQRTDTADTADDGWHLTETSS